VEVLVCDNASPDGGATEAAIADILSRHPGLRALRNAENVGFDLNYLRLVEEARGEFVWVLGDDDEWLPGSVARVLQELDLGADACLCLAHGCDMEMNPRIMLPWYMADDAPRVWHLQGREDLIGYFNGCARNAGAFAFISVAIFRRDRLLEHKDALLESVAKNPGYGHLWGMMCFLRQPTVLRYIPEPLILNRMDHIAESSNYYNRWMLDLRAWATVADHVFGEDPELWKAFSCIVGRNHHDTILNGLRLHSETEAQWQEAKPYLLRAGFPAIRIAAVEQSFQILFQNRVPSPRLKGAFVCLADLGLVARAARRIAVLALGSLEDLFLGAPLLASLRASGRPVRVLTTAQGALYLNGFEVKCVDPARYLRDVPYRDAEADSLAAFDPELIVNLDRNRELGGDDLVSAVQPPAALAFELPDRGQDPQLVRAVNDNYHCMLPKNSAPEALLEALDLDPVTSGLWPPKAALREAESHLGKLGWDPARTMAVIVDHPSFLDDPSFRALLSEAAQEGWNLVGLGGRDTHARLGAVLAPWKQRAVNLKGLNPPAVAAVLGHCARFIGGTPVLQAMARACGCSQGCV